MKRYLMIILILGCMAENQAQDSTQVSNSTVTSTTRAYSPRRGKREEFFNPIYPIGDNPNIGYKTSMVSQETILFEANPWLRLSIVNNMRRKFMNGTPDNKDWKLKHLAFAWYINYRPQLRMYTDNSKPVKTPSAKISILGFQLAKILESKKDKLSMLAASFESGHFSNGQDRCAFNADIADQTQQCDSVYNLITDDTDLSKILNRNSGNFSTNYTEIIANYKWFICVDDKYRPKKTISAKAGVTIYHNKLLGVGNIGGFSDADIKIYGRSRFVGGVDYMWRLSDDDLKRFVVSLSAELIVKPHPSVNPWRTDLSFTYFMNNNMGFFVSANIGHDNYNYRFVDSGFQIYSGITFDIFPPVELKK